MTNSADNLRKLSRWFGVLAALGLILLAFVHDDALAAETKRNVRFDHVKTGFPLTGAHVTLPCETCHVQGTFKGTPKNCETCHTPGSRIQGATAKPSNHIPTTQPCSQCHSSTASWKVARFTHVGVTPRQCGQCHNNSTAPGKPARHPVTNQPCDACHRTTTWMSAGFTHMDVKPGACATCHNGSQASGKPGNHIPTSLSCDACHTTGGMFTTSRFTHSATQGVTPGQCSSCHNGSYTHANALGKTANHPVTTASCDNCHSGYASFVMTGSTFNHSGVIPGACATCHNGSQASGKPGNHIPTSLSCDACHGTGTTFTTSTFNHSATQGVIAGQCATCHNGSYTQWNALGKHPTHVATTASCDTCHTGYASFAGAGFNHTGVAPGTCANCHNGTQAVGKSAGHMVTMRACDSCHRSTATGGFLLPVTYSHASVYFTTHSAGVNSNCKGCHKANTETIAGVTAYEPPNCYACHAGNFKPGSHKKTETPTTIFYTAVELRNCAGSCHQYTDNTFITILKSRSGEHRATSGGF